MRLASALYTDFHPFHVIPTFTTTDVISKVEDVKAGDCLIVWGGADIHPSFYGKGRSQHSYASHMPSKRDILEWEMMKRCVELGNPIIGVCRGAQMLCALAGGILAQHVEGHGGMHIVRTHDGQEFNVNSVHHQMMFPVNTEHNLVAWCKEKRSKVYHDDVGTLQIEVEPEFIHFPKVKGFAIQWHPEAIDDNHPSAKYINTYIKEHL